jgi:hypothetical protein
MTTQEYGVLGNPLVDISSHLRGIFVGPALGGWIAEL